MSEMKLIMDSWRKVVNENEADEEGVSNIKTVRDVQTIGDLKALIQTAQLKKRGDQLKGGVVDAAKSAVVDELIGKVPFLASAKTMFDFAKQAYQLPDESRSGTALDYLDVDDDVSKIVDDPIENAFLKTLGATLEKMDDRTPLKNLNITKLLQNYISQNFNKRTVSGTE
tara:strand:- start:2138 stop:2647 length:510 start_codon:yes stop_codon:yes gene_type:complete